MRHLHLSLIALFALLLLPAAGCPIRPTPTGSGGSPAATGGAPAGGSLDAGCSSSTVVQGWPECAPEGARAAPVVRHALGRIHAADQSRGLPDLTVLDVPDCGWLPLFASLDQGPIGACTGFAALQCRLSAPWAWAGAMTIEELNRIALGIYSGATKRDPWAGSWPPEDTGSGGQWALDEAMAQGYFNGYDAVATFAGLQQALQRGPCIAGTNWHDGMFAPDRCGAIHPTGAVAGGHEWVIQGIRHSTRQVLGRTSWGNAFGAQWHGKGGFFWLTYDEFMGLLNAGGDAHCPHVGPANDNAVRLREAG